jgi:hypothetical protein
MARISTSTWDLCILYRNVIDVSSFSHVTGAENADSAAKVRRIDCEVHKRIHFEGDLLSSLNNLQ